MSVKLYAFTCGHLTMPLGSFLRGEKGQLTVPVPAYLVVHPRGNVLFDTGMHTALLEEQTDYLGPLSAYIQVHYRQGDEVSAQLARLGLTVRDIDFVVTSHLHFDHGGGLAQLPNAPLVIQHKEWDYATSAASDDDISYNPAEYDIGKDVKAVHGEHDLFGDGTVVCLPTYGHTVGHQSLRVRLASGEVVLAGDACYLRQSLERLHLPYACYDEDAMLASFRILRDLQARGARIFYGHDPEFWTDIPQAPELAG